MTTMSMMDSRLAQHERDLEYLKHDGKKCPFCGVVDCIVMTGELQHEGTAIFQEVKCEKCATRWVDCYELTGISAMEDLAEQSDFDEQL